MKKKIILIVGILVIVLMSMVSCSAISTMLNRSNTVNYQVDIRDLENANVGTAVASNAINSCVRIVSTFNVAGDANQTYNVYFWLDGPTIADGDAGKTFSGYISASATQ